MRTLIAPYFWIIVLVPTLVFGQTLKPGEWQTYTSMRSVTAVAVSSDSNYIWAATSGGAFRADLRNSQAALISLHTTDGLTENDLTSVAADADGNIYFGGGSGGFDIYNSSNGSIIRVPDIHSSPYANKTINSITVAGNKIYVATGYGVSVYLPLDGVFGATATQLASLPSQDSIQQVIDNGSYVFAAAHEGIAWASDASDLHASSNWHILPDSGGSVRALTIFNGTVYAGAANGLFAISQNRDSLVPITLPVPPVVSKLLATSDSLYILDQSGMLYSTKDFIHVSQRPISSEAGSVVTAIAYKANNGVIAGSISNGIAYSVLGSLQNNIFPPGPIANAFTDLSFSTSTDQLFMTNQFYGFGIFQPDTDGWLNFQNGVGNVPNVYWGDVLYDSIRNVTWFTGGPVYKVSGLGSPSPVWTKFDTTGGMLPGYQQGDDDISAGCMIDATGNFVVTTWAANGKGLCISSDGETFNDYSLTSSTGIFQPWGCVTQDMNGNYWVGTVEHDLPKSTGVYWLNAANGNYGEIPGGDQGSLGPPIEGTEFVNAILTDQDDGIWCGTEGGVEIISDPESILQNNQAPASIRSVQFTTNQVVYSMAVDGVGNKWIGTTNGIFIVSPDGSDSVAHFTAENSPLVNDDIISLAIDPTRGEAYAATPSGISRFSTIFKQGKPDYSSIRVYPNPVVQTASAIPGANSTITIDGLVAGSTIQIFSLAGQLITTIDGTALGATVTWNGRDALGRQVPSGMYLISATSPQSGENGEAKVIIVRKPSN